MVDIATGWSERVAVVGRGDAALEAGFRRGLGRRPCAIRELPPDNGGAFFDHHLRRFSGEGLTGLRRSRSRPDHKNDTRLVEQKNDTLVRASVGHGRLDTAEQAAALNRIYGQCWRYYNLFQPVRHRREKVVTAARLRRRWEAAPPPYQRLVATGALHDAWRATLDARHARTNPRQLRRAIYDELAQLGRRPGAQARAAD